MKRISINPLLWGASVAMSWTWGLGLFFSVQIAIQFGLAGLLAFAIPNALGLVLFGFLTHGAARGKTPAEFERHFFASIKNYRWVFWLYQIVALALTFFAALQFILLPMGVSRLLGALLVMACGLILGEQFNISRVKFSHSLMYLASVVAAAVVAMGIGPLLRQGSVAFAGGLEPVRSLSFLGYLVPMMIGLLLGPWLDLQQWQRAIQAHREGASPRTTFLIGGVLFFFVLLFHGGLASLVFHSGGMALVTRGADGLMHAEASVMHYLFSGRFGSPNTLVLLSYLAFLLLMIVSTLDSGYLALRWFLGECVKKSESAVLSIIPASFVGSPVPHYLLAAVVALLSIPLRFELEYYMVFYATFSVGYSIFVLTRSAVSSRVFGENITTTFALAALSVGLFGIGYFQQAPVLMIGGSLLPFAHATVTVLGWIPGIVEEKMAAVRTESKVASEKLEKHAGTVVEEPAAEQGPSAGQAPTIVRLPEGSLSAGVGLETLGTQGVTSWFEGKWYVHTFMSTYNDTNSVGNVYFANYAVWVGKTRELFFRHVMPNFDLRDTPFYILTREFQHKFVKETREFEQIFVKIRIGPWNRKFVTLEHEVLDGARTLLGKGKQVLLFVSAKDYTIIDLPAEVQRAFLPHA